MENAMSTWVTARDVPEIRARMAAWARDPGTDGAANWFRFFLGPSPAGATESRVFDRIDDVGATIAGTLAAQFPAAELFYVSADMTDRAGHAADTLTDYRLHPEDLPAEVGVMVYEHPPVTGTANARHDDISVVSWGPGRGGLWVHTWAASSASRQRSILRIGRTLAQAPHDQVLAQARAAAARGLPEPTPTNKPTTDDETAEQAADHILAMFLPNLERAPVPPSFAPPHGYDWCALTPMEFTEMEGWPGGVVRRRVRGRRRRHHRLAAHHPRHVAADGPDADPLRAAHCTPCRAPPDRARRPASRPHRALHRPASRPPTAPPKTARAQGNTVIAG
jgi:hypothetical protein